MRDLALCGAALLACVAAPALGQDSPPVPASAPAPITFTRAELATMSNEELAARALAAIAGSARSARGGPSSSFFSRGSSPWVGEIDVDLPSRAEQELCEYQELHLELEPVHYEPARLSDPDYDPPAAISRVGLRTGYADSATVPSCAGPAGLNYFTAPDAQAALTAIRAFRLFRRGAVAGTLRGLSCRSEFGGPPCRESLAGLALITRFNRVLWMDAETVTLDIGNDQQLRLTLEIRPGAAPRLTRIELVLRPSPPPV